MTTIAVITVTKKFFGPWEKEKVKVSVGAKECVLAEYTVLIMGIFQLRT